MTTITTDSGLQYIELTVGEGDEAKAGQNVTVHYTCLLYTSPSPRDRQKSRMPSSA